jgi:hypothetical protein
MNMNRHLNSAETPIVALSDAFVVRFGSDRINGTYSPMRAPPTNSIPITDRAIDLLSPPLK